MEVLPSSGSVYSGSNSVEFIFYRRRILWRTKEIWLSRYSLHDCGVGTLRFQWLRRLYCDLVEVWERYRTAKHKPKSSTTWKAKKRIHLNPEQFQWMKKCRNCSFISVCCINEKSWGAMWHRASGQFFHGFGFLGVWSRVGLSWFSRFFAWFHGFKNPFCAWDFCTFHRSKELRCSMLSQIASLAPGTMMLLVAYAFLQEKILGKSGEARNRKQMKLKLRIR